MPLTILLVLAVTSLVAATVNGALGYGYSSISVPIALLVVVGRVLNPALVVIEVVINLYALFWNRAAVRRVIHRVVPLITGLVPGVIVGALLLGHIAPASVKLVVYCVLLPLIVLQASGKRFPIRRERSAAVPLGGMVGILYGLTTISGPPLALFWNNQGLAKEDFKVSLAIVRSVESIFALCVYAYLGLVTWESTSLLPWIAPGVVIGVPIGHWLILRVPAETFRRVCMSFDAYLVAFGLSRALIEVGIEPLVAYQALALTSILDTILLWGFFRDVDAARLAKAVTLDGAFVKPAEIVGAARLLANAEPAEILAWGAAHVPKLTFATGFGAEGCVLIDLVARAQLPIDLFTLDTGVLFPETYALWRQLEARYGVTIRSVAPAQSIDAQAAAHGGELWTRDPDRCCELRKVVPLRDALAGWDGWVTAIRRDQSAARATAEPVEHDDKFGLVKINPLVAWTHDDVWRYVRAYDVPTNPLHARGYPSIGCAPCTSAVIPGESLRSGRWRHAQGKTECGLHGKAPA